MVVVFVDKSRKPGMGLTVVPGCFVVGYDVNPIGKWVEFPNRRIIINECISTRNPGRILRVTGFAAIQTIVYHGEHYWATGVRCPITVIVFAAVFAIRCRER